MCTHGNAYIFCFSRFSGVDAINKLFKYVSEWVSAFDSKYVANKWSDGILLDFISPTLYAFHMEISLCTFCNWMRLLLGTLSIVKWNQTHTNWLQYTKMYIYVLCNTSIFFRVSPAIRTIRNSSLLVLFLHP